MIQELTYFQAVNTTTTTKDLTKVVTTLFDEGALPERDKDYTLDAIKNLSVHESYLQNITRLYGIRQQALMLNHYKR